MFLAPLSKSKTTKTLSSLSTPSTSLPISHTDLLANEPWPHQNQDSEKAGFRCLEGLVNILPNGPDDGSLIVCDLLSKEFHVAMKDKPQIPAWVLEWFGYTERGMKWLEEKGLKWVKVCAEPGALLVWDSRTPHYNLSSKIHQPRFATYICRSQMLHKKISSGRRMRTSDGSVQLTSLSWMNRHFS